MSDDIILTKLFFYCWLFLDCVHNLPILIDSADVLVCDLYCVQIINDHRSWPAVYILLSLLFKYSL